MVESGQRSSQRLDDRIKHTPQQFQQALSGREQLIATKGAYAPETIDVSTSFFPGSYYLTSVDENLCRTYSKTPY
uniref:Hydroxymethylglutaryl-coenzyme A synthase C-terminal domain-containing protein n=1 Tax=Ditylenchus dipsaci TaxID=166011 RepID=A0A915D546_9BILA